MNDDQLLTELAGLKQRIAEIEKQLQQRHDGGAQAAATAAGNQGLAPASGSPASEAAAASEADAAAAAAAAVPAAVPMSATRIVMHQIVRPQEVDSLGICCGGQVLSWIDLCAGLAAKTLARGPCVTISVDAVHFFRPCRLGDVCLIAAMVNRTFASSMEVGVRVEAEDMRTGVRRHCCSAYLTFVSLKGKQQQQQQQQQQHGAAGTSQLPRVLPTTSQHRRIHSQAESRREARLAARAAARADPHQAAALAACRLKPITHREGCPSLPPALKLNPSDAPSDQQQQQQQQQQQDRASATAAGVVGSSGSKASASIASRRRVAPSETTAFATHSVFPQHANTLSITFGGQVMSWMEQCAYISASRLRGTHLLTAGMDSITFAASTRVGSILYVTAQVTAIFNSSMEVMISVFGENPSEGRVFHCADAFATVAVVDLQGRPTSIPFALEPSTRAEKLRCQDAEQRRADRLAMRAAMAAAESCRPSLDGSTPVASPAGSAGGQGPAADDAGDGSPAAAGTQEQQWPGSGIEL